VHLSLLLAGPWMCFVPCHAVDGPSQMDQIRKLSSYALHYKAIVHQFSKNFLYFADGNLKMV
ncbi:unnamed protein product, partial [Bubo scandiacus]